MKSAALADDEANDEVAARSIAEEIGNPENVNPDIEADATATLAGVWSVLNVEELSIACGAWSQASRRRTPAVCSGQPR